MNKLLHKFVFIAFVLQLAWGCQSLEVNTAQVTSPPSENQPETLPFEAKNKPADELSNEIVYHYLAAAISGQRKQLDDSFEHYLQAAMLAKDPVAAEKAARIALFRKKPVDAMRATSLWVEYAPNSIHARQLSAILNLRAGEHQLALQQFEALLQISAAKDIEGFEHIAILLAGEDNSAESIRLMDSLVTQYENDPHAHYSAALLNMEKKRYDQALEYLNKALSLDPKWDKPIVLEAKVLATQGREQEATRKLGKSIQRLPDNKVLRLAYGRLLVDSNQYEKALAQFEAAQEIDPEDLGTLYAVAMLATQIEDYKTARNAWNQLRSGNDKEKRNDATYFLAQIEELEGNTQKAMDLYAEIKDGKIHTDAQLRLAGLKAANDQLEDAREIFRQLRVLDYHRSAQIYILEAQTLIDLGHDHEALKVFNTAIAAIPDDLDLRYARGLFAAEQGDIALAEKDFQYILEEQPEHADTLNALGYTLADQTDRYEEAYTYILKAYQLKPDNPAILDSLGWVYYRLGDYKQALNYLQKAAASNSDAEIAAHLGEVFWMTGDRDKARDIWNKALKEDPESPKLKEVMQRLQ